MKNFNHEIERNFVYFYDTETHNARFFAKSPLVIDAMKTGRYNDVRQKVISERHKELHLSSGTRDNMNSDEGNGRKKIASLAALDSKSKDIKDMLTKEGFEEF